MKVNNKWWIHLIILVSLTSLCYFFLSPPFYKEKNIEQINLSLSKENNEYKSDVENIPPDFRITLSEILSIPLSPRWIRVSIKNISQFNFENNPNLNKDGNIKLDVYFKKGDPKKPEGFEKPENFETLPKEEQFYIVLQGKTATFFYRENDIPELGIGMSIDYLGGLSPRDVYLAYTLTPHIYLLSEISKFLLILIFITVFYSSILTIFFSQIKNLDSSIERKNSNNKFKNGAT